MKLITHPINLTLTLAMAVVILSNVGYSFAASNQAKSRSELKLYVGANSTEALMSFKSNVEIISNYSPDAEDAETQISHQVEHLFGPMGEADIKAVPRGNHKVKISKIWQKNPNTYVIDYTYAGTIVLENGPTSTYDIILPINPDTIYSAGMVGNKNPCTDHHYQSEGDFWYFWNPNKYGCKLKKDIDYKVISAKIKRIQNTTQTYPEYEKLVNDKNEVVMTLLMGMDDPGKVRDPNTSMDINASNFRDIKSSLLKRGYSNRLWSKEEIKKVIKESTRTKFYIEEFSKEFTHSQTGQKYKVILNIFFGPSGIDEDNIPFHYFYKDAIENSSIMMYDGHSGLGGHLDLESIEEARGFTFMPSQDKYQIYFFNSCTSYTYYNTMYFARKKTTMDPKGTKNLDILTNGLATYFSVMHDTNMALIVAVEKWLKGEAVISYQTLAKSIDSGNLFGVNGDEDNPTKN